MSESTLAGLAGVGAFSLASDTVAATGSTVSPLVGAGAPALTDDTATGAGAAISGLVGVGAVALAADAVTGTAVILDGVAAAGGMQLVDDVGSAAGADFGDIPDFGGLNEVITGLGAATYTVVRTGAGIYDHGRYVVGGPSTFTIVAGVEPVTGRELYDMPEGQRGDEVVKIFTAYPLRTRAPGNDPDVILYRGEPWTVVNVALWDGLGQIHYEAKAVRAPSPAGTVP
jgi:hypothetical protein